MEMELGASAFQRPYGGYVLENVLFKISFPAEFHAQTAVECAMALHRKVRDRLDVIRRITVRTHESAIRIIDKQGPLARMVCVEDRFPPKQQRAILDLALDAGKLASMPVHEFVDLFVI